LLKHTRIMNVCCNSCNEVKPNAVLLHIPSSKQNIIIAVCAECLETLASATKYPDDSGYRLSSGVVIPFGEAVGEGKLTPEQFQSITGRWPY
jgi:hypothetical protein